MSTNNTGHIGLDQVILYRSYRSYCTIHIEHIDHIDHVCQTYTDLDHTDQVSHVYTDQTIQVT